MTREEKIMIAEMQEKLAWMEAEIKRLTAPAEEVEVDAVLEIAQVRAAGMDLAEYLRGRARRNAPRLKPHPHPCPPLEREGRRARRAI